ncbi:NAD(P)/FAD-dependent oxidoreductase [Amphibiibacter pelophylacis]|uniref:FAD-dependent oxidoreductase n=1 Tax=Amphibiibacter pelophylacis TaxID=1799477 RepID=A0ACC6P1Z2_9BURK
MPAHTVSSPQRIAVVGAGIAGLASAWLLSRHHRVTLFEAEPRLGGHSNTVDVTVDGHTHPVDTGFLVFNDRTYPNLIALFAHLGVPSVPTEMTFAVSLNQPNLEWAGSTLATVFGQKRNLVSPAFWGMLRDILRFNRESTAWLAAHAQGQSSGGMSLRQFLDAGRYSTAFRDWYLLPMAAAIWSCPTAQMQDMPLAPFVRFCVNHGLLQIFDRPQWRTVQGGSREYVRRIADQLDDIRTGSPVRAVQRLAAESGAAPRVRLLLDSGPEDFDQVVMACHSDQSLEILGDTASPGQREVLAAVRYQPNRAVLHTDPALLPRDRRLWSAWNYLADSPARAGQADASVGVSYLINRLQPLPFSTPVVVTLNPPRPVAQEHIHAQFDYAHPVFDAAAVAAQQRLPQVQGEGGIWLAGAWGRYGFHEDGLMSALAVARGFGIEPPWSASSVSVTPAPAPEAVSA